MKEIGKTYLGFNINTIRMTVSAPQKKLESIMEMVKINVSHDMIPVKTMAAIMGKITSLEVSHGMLARLTPQELVRGHCLAYRGNGLVRSSQDDRRHLP